MSKIKVKDIYALPATDIDSFQLTLSSRWLPELSDLIGGYGCSAPAQLVEENRFVIKSLIDERYNGGRYSHMRTIWFDGKPVLIFQEAGRSGQDHFKRWVTDKETYVEVLAYLVEMLTVRPDTFEDRDYVDPESEVYPEELLHFYGNSHLEKFGMSQEPAMEGATLLRNESFLLSTLPTDQYLVFLKDGAEDIPEYIRRQGFVLKKVRLISQEEIKANNPRMLEVNRANGENRVFLYAKACAPEGTYVQPI